MLSNGDYCVANITEDECNFTIFPCEQLTQFTIMCEPILLVGFML